MFDRLTMAIKVFLVTLVLTAVVYSQSEKKAAAKHIVFEGARIDGQMGTLKALIVTTEKRPEFSPMALKLAHQKWELKSINKKVHIVKSFMKQPIQSEFCPQSWL